MSMIAFYTGASGMRAFQSGMDVVAHNIANVQTNGYKMRRAAFQDLLFSRINTNVQGNHLVGHGVKQEKIDQLMLQAGLDQTAYELDFAIVGEGFFQVSNNGQIQYTRNGAFDISAENGVPYLVTNQGAYVLDRGGNRIALSKNAVGSYTTADLRERLGVYTFPNPWGLNPENASSFTQSANSGTAQLITPGGEVEVLQGALEFSGTDLSAEMVNLITYQRGFQVNSRVLQTADQIADEINNLR